MKLNPLFCKRIAIFQIRSSLLFVLFISFCGSLYAGSCEQPAQLRLSMVPQGGMQQDIVSMQLLVNALETALGIPVVVMEPSSYGAVTEGLLSGAVDLARLGPASYVEAKRADPRITAFASYARKADQFAQEGAAYHSLLIVRSASPYASLLSLHGQKVALVDPDSTSGAVIPRHMVEREITRKFEQHFGQIVYTGGHDNSIEALMRNDVRAAFVSSTHLSDMIDSGKVRSNDIRILWRSGRIPLDPFVYRGQLCENIKQKITTVFLKRGGQNYPSLLKNLNAIRFLPVKDNDYQIIRSVSTGK